MGPSGDPPDIPAAEASRFHPQGLCQPLVWWTLLETYARLSCARPPWVCVCMCVCVCVCVVSVSLLVLNASRRFPRVCVWPEPSVTSEAGGTLGPGTSLPDAASPPWTGTVPL